MTDNRNNEELRADELTADEAIELVLKRPGMYGLTRTDEFREVEAERDAALAAVERVRAIHYPFTPQLCYMNAQGGQSPMTSVHCHSCNPEGSNRVGDPDTWPCPTVAALDGAPEPDKGCGTCFTCIDREVSAKPFPHNLEYPFIVCAECGNKRCPKAENHDNSCTRSNEPGQPGALRNGGLPVEGEKP